MDEVETNNDIKTKTWFKVLKYGVGVPLTILSLVSVWVFVFSYLFFSLLGGGGWNGPRQPNASELAICAIIYSVLAAILFLCAALMAHQKTPNPFKKASAAVTSVSLIVILCYIMVSVSLHTSGSSVAAVEIFTLMMIAPTINIFTPKRSRTQHIKTSLKIVVPSFFLWAFLSHAELVWGWETQSPLLILALAILFVVADFLTASKKEKNVKLSQPSSTELEESTLDERWQNINIKTIIAAPLLLLNFATVAAYMAIFVKFDCSSYINEKWKHIPPGFPYSQPNWHRLINKICIEPITPPNLLITTFVLALSSFISYVLILTILKNRITKKEKDLKPSQLSNKAIVITLSVLILLVLFYVVQLQTIQNILYT